jgi:hypothetical protein
MPRPWTKDDVRLLKILSREKMSVRAMARNLNRTVGAIRQKAGSLEVRLPGARGVEAASSKGSR